MVARKKKKIDDASIEMTIDMNDGSDVPAEVAAEAIKHLVAALHSVEEKMTGKPAETKWVLVSAKNTKGKRRKKAERRQGRGVGG